MTITINALVFCLTLSVIHSQCPTMSSGSCFVDCTNASLYNIACEAIKGVDLYNDLVVYSQSSQPIALSVWNTPLNRIGSAVLNLVSNQMRRLELDNLQQLQWFPELTEQTLLTELVIMNSPLLNEMPLELLPQSIQKITLFRVGITHFFNDIQETVQLPNLHVIIIAQSRISYIQPGYFDFFPELSQLRIMDSTFLLQEAMGSNMFRTKKPLKLLQIMGNNFVFPSGFLRQGHFLEDVIGNTLMDPGSILDISGNHLPMSRTMMVDLAHRRHVKQLVMKRNIFDALATLKSKFDAFDELELLDLSHTNLLRGNGIFAGLRKLSTLRIAGNYFNDLTSTRIFNGFQSSSLRFLDLSSNNLEYFPIGMENASRELIGLDFSFNRMKLEKIYTHREETYITPLSMFKKLKKFDISNNRLGTLKGIWLADLKSLVHLNTGCNGFRSITKEYFRHLPSSLRILNLTFCVDQSANRPKFDSDSFSTLPPIKSLILQQGMLKEGFLTTLQSIAIPSLEEVDLSYNAISIWPDTIKNMEKLKPLKTLKLRFNLLQSLHPGAFSSFVFLKELDLSRNRIIAIGKNDFTGLHNLKTLTLAGNTILNVEAEAFAPLGRLRELYMGENNDTDLRKMFPLYSKSGSSLVHLGIQEMPLDCIPAEVFQQLKKLKWLYLNESRSVNLNFGSFRKLHDMVTYQYPFKLFAFRVPKLEDLGCDSYDDWPTVYNRSARFVVKDKSNSIAQHVTVNFPGCHMGKRRRLQEIIQNLVC